LTDKIRQATATLHAPTGPSPGATAANFDTTAILN